MSEEKHLSKEEIKAMEEKAKAEFLKKDHYHREEVTSIVKELKTDLNTGLTQAEAESRLEKYGLNELEKEEKDSLWDKIKE